MAKATGEPLFSGKGGRGGKAGATTVARSRMTGDGTGKTTTAKAKPKTTPARKAPAKKTAPATSTVDREQLAQLRGFLLKRSVIPMGHRDGWLGALDRAIGDEKRETA